MTTLTMCHASWSRDIRFYKVRSFAMQRFSSKLSQLQHIVQLSIEFASCPSLAQKVQAEGRVVPHTFCRAQLALVHHIS